MPYVFGGWGGHEKNVPHQRNLKNCVRVLKFGEEMESLQLSDPEKQNLPSPRDLRFWIWVQIMKECIEKLAD